MSQSITRSRDGFEWTEQRGLRPGVPCIGAIQPSVNLPKSQTVFDVIVAGAGYTGLTAARDAALAGLKVLVLEARDRIGGRSWSSNIDGYPFEMGGTWVHWGQPHVWREISRYNMRDHLEVSQSFEGGVNSFTLASKNGLKSMSHVEEDALMESALNKFANVDGDLGRTTLPYPHNAGYNSDVWQYDKLTCRDRINQIADSLTADELCGLEGYLLMTSGSTIETMSFFEFLHWWSLCGHNYKGCIEYLIKYKFRGGQSSFAINFWNEACSTGNLAYSFGTPVAKVIDHGSYVDVIAKGGQKFSSRRLISALPLNILDSIEVSPPLDPKRAQAAKIGNPNQCVKVHAEIRNKNLRSWSGIDRSSAGLVYSFGDGTTPAGNTHIVAFGAVRNHLQPEEDATKTLAAMTKLVPMDVKRLVFHNWHKDEFAKGAWFFPGKEFISNYHEALRARHGSVLFANSDWAIGWRSFIDGAIEEGARAAHEVINELRSNQRPKLEQMPRL